MIGLDTLEHPLIALGIGLLIGAERERRKLARATSAAARFGAAAQFIVG